MFGQPINWSTNFYLQDQSFTKFLILELLESLPQNICFLAANKAIE